MKPFILLKALFCRFWVSLRSLGNMRGANVGEGFHLILNLLSLHVQILLEHLLLIHQLLIELLELPELSHNQVSH